MSPMFGGGRPDFSETRGFEIEAVCRTKWRLWSSTPGLATGYLFQQQGFLTRGNTKHTDSVPGVIFRSWRGFCSLEVLQPKGGYLSFLTDFYPFFEGGEG